MKTIIGVGKKSGEGVWIDVAGLEDLDAILKNIPELAKAAARHELQVSLDDLKGRAMEKCPVLSGDLRGSAFYETSWNGNNLEGVVGFSLPYALAIHEGINFTFTDPTKEAKFLENPFKERVGPYITNIGDAIKGAMP